MESFLIAVVAMAVVLGIMILVHEFGHYAAAKYFGRAGGGILHRLRQTPGRALRAAIPTTASVRCRWADT